jgi:hypothetical protein
MELEMALQGYQRICTLHRGCNPCPGTVRHALRHNTAREGREQCVDVGKHESARIG